MSRFVCIFEDKKFSNFFPLSLSQPVFEIRIGFQNFRLRLQEELGAESNVVLCRDYLAPLMNLKDPGIRVNELPGDDALFVNGRLICYGDELKELMDRIPENGIAVKGGYVIAAKLAEDSAESLASYIQTRISAGAIEKLCAELREHGERMRPASAAKSSKKKAPPEEHGEGTLEDEHAIGQDSVAEKLPQQLRELIDRHKITLVEIPEARLLSFPWQIIEENPAVIEDDFQKLRFRGQSEESIIYPGVQLVGEENIVIGEAVVIKSGAVLDASTGPIVINDGTLIMPNATLIGPVYVGKQSLIRSGAKILEGTSIGDVCKIGGEIDATIVAAYSNKQHDGFIGHSYVGEWVNIGAGSNNSDLKNNYSPVRMWCAGLVRQTGRQFLGLIMGDHSKTGISTMFNSGTVIGFNCNIYGSDIPRNFVPSFSWGQGQNMTQYELEKAMLTAQVVMERRSVKFEEAHKTVFKKIYHFSQLAERNI